MGKIHYYAEEGKGITKCLLNDKRGMIVPFKEDGTLENYSRSFDKKSLFDNEKEAQERLDYLDMLYNRTFIHRPFVKEEILVNNINKFIHIDNEINVRLEGFPYFAGIDFCDVSAGGIQIRGHHALIKGYTYGNQITIKYDFSNYLECVDQFVEMWKDHDVPEKVRSYQGFIEQGERWGWD